ncbi:pre-B-cell leukemia transcription factor-interacting protein 1 isoform X4 [Pimephales promelas]|uniref:pre-B-cell leukemia transcription factor-interacting protein 1 isoform X4 n=1 Tax=Pimephales promelas TaxID=90988 RepID=UPI001955CE92|nr:pre-B-cell leukemia transcription factor-interacting protein 1 isoform X4 [Pimephales promelas]KAG1948579.1 pre-B-cell leukemia transcription factor-interacting protein [Pimephales promelas]
MSDNSTGSTGSSSNSWTLLSPEEAAADPAAPVDDGTESIGDAPSLSEEIAGSSLEVRSHDPETPMMESVLSEEGHQICQETSPDFFEEMAASGHGDIELDPEIHAPVIHDTITSSPPDSDLLGAVPFSITTESAFQFSEEAVLDEPTEEDVTDIFPGQHVPVQESPAPDTVPRITSPPEPLREISSSLDVSDVTADISPAPKTIESSAIPVLDIHADVHPTPETPPLAPPSEADAGFGSTPESPAPYSPYPETIGSVETEEEPIFEKDEIELPDKFPDVIREPESLGAEFPAGTSAEDDGLRHRHVQPTIVLKRSSDDDEDEEEEEEFTLPVRKEEKRGFSLNQLIVGALVLLCVGSFFFSEDFDGSELSDQEVLDKLAQENTQINILEAQIESQKQELDRALKMTTDMHSTERGALENENTKLKEQLSELPGLRDELQTLRARVAELAKLTVEDSPQQAPDSGSPPSTAESSPEGTEKPWDKKEELKRQKALLEESRTRLEGMKKQGLRESLVEMQKRLSKQVDQLGKREDWKRKHQEHKGEKKEWGRKKEHDSRWKKDETGSGKEWKRGKDKRKDHLKKYKEEWDHKKDERRQERERRQKERPWEAKPSKHHHHHHHHKEQVDFWKHQEEKLRRNRHPAEGCHGVSNCADAEGLVPVKLVEFQDLLEIYLSKLEGVPQESKESLSRLTAQFFSGGFFAHDRMLFSDFAEDVADILEDLADGLEDEQHDNDSLEDEMEEFEKEVLLKFAAPLP